jgi:hypothetical protein
MPKLRNSNTDTGAFAQWIGRKCRNHQPLKELKMSPEARAKKPRTYRSGGRSDVRITDDERIVYREAGRTFVVDITEVDDEQAELLMACSEPVGS